MLKLVGIKAIKNKENRTLYISASSLGLNKQVTLKHGEIALMPSDYATSLLLGNSCYKDVTEEIELSLKRKKPEIEASLLTSEVAVDEVK